jgi:hypothetical protein
MGDQLSKTTSQETPNLFQVIRNKTYNEFVQDIECANESMKKFGRGQYRFNRKDVLPVEPLWKFLVEIVLDKTDSSAENSKLFSRKMNIKQFYRLYFRIKECDVLISNSKQHQQKQDEMIASISLRNDPLCSFLEEIADDKECLICMERQSDIVLSCTHAFCTSCLNMWKSKNLNCPMCRTPLGSEDEDWVLAPIEEPEESELLSYLDSCLSQYSK